MDENLWFFSFKQTNAQKNKRNELTSVISLQKTYVRVFL